METIDFHTHVFPDNLAPKAIAKVIENSPESHNYTDGTLSGLRRSMQRNGISRSVLLPIATKPSQVSIINRACLSQSGADTIPFGTLFPLFEGNAQEIAFLCAQGIKGVKFHPEYQDFYIDDPKYFPMYGQLADAGLVVLFHAGEDPGPFSCDHALPQAIRTVQKNFPRMKIVAAHMGGWRVWKEVEEILCGLPIYLDTSAIGELLAPDDFMRMTRIHGTEHILFATDSPWFDQGESLRWIDRCSLTTGEKERIFGGNAVELLKL